METFRPYEERSSRVLPEQVKLLFRGAFEAYLATILNAGLLAYIQARVIAPSVVIAWLAYMTAVTGARTLLVYRYWHSADPASEAPRWMRRHAIGTVLAGIGWGAVGLLLYPPGSFVHQVFLLFVLGGMAGAAVTVLTARIEIFLLFLLPTLSPITLRLFMEQDDTHATMGLMLVVYMLALIFAAFRMHRTIAVSLDMRIENADLVAHLLAAKEHAERLNKGLTSEIGQREMTEAALRERTHELLVYQTDLRRLASRLQRTEQRERQGLAADLHDNLAQLLALCKLRLAMLRGDRETSDPLSTRIAQLQTHVDDALLYTRRLMADLRPAIIGDGSDVTAAVRWVVEKVQRHGLLVRVHDDGRPKHLDEDVLTVTYQCLHELLFNVLKHAQTTQASVTLSARAHTLRVVVRDTGIGFKVPTKPKPSTDRGFGLFNMYEQVDVIGGQLKIVSILHRGTCARLTVPMKTAIRSATLPQPAQAGVERHKLRVLVVDDHRMFREGLRTILNEEADIEVVAEASDGESAVQMAHETHPDVVVMDVNMPRMNGVDATRHIKMDRPEVTVIGLSVQDEQGMARIMAAAGASAYVSKTGAFDVLVNHIRHLTAKA